MVEVFNTNVQELEIAKQIIQLLLEHFPLYKINFDLEDCDKILRIESNNIIPNMIIAILESKNLQCQILN